MRLNEIKDNAGSRKTRIRIGRGIGSGMGAACCSYMIGVLVGGAMTGCGSTGGGVKSAAP